MSEVTVGFREKMDVLTKQIVLVEGSLRERFPDTTVSVKMNDVSLHWSRSNNEDERGLWVLIDQRMVRLISTPAKYRVMAIFFLDDLVDSLEMSTLERLDGIDRAIEGASDIISRRLEVSE